MFYSQEKHVFIDVLGLDRVGLKPVGQKSKNDKTKIFPQKVENRKALPVGFFRSLATKLLENLGVLGLGAFFRLVTYPLPMVGR